MILVSMKLVFHMGDLVPVEYLLSVEHGLQWLRLTYREASIELIGRVVDPAGLVCNGRMFLFPFNNLEFFERAAGIHEDADSWSFEGEIPEGELVASVQDVDLILLSLGRAG